MGVSSHHVSTFSPPAPKVRFIDDPMQRTTTNSLPWWKLLLYVACGNTLIAIVLWLAEGHGFGAFLTLSQCIGLSICFACQALERLVGDRWGRGVLFGW